MTDDDKAALGPKGVAVAEALGRGLPDLLAAVLPWLQAVDNWMKADADDPESPPECPIDALLAAVRTAPGSFALRGGPALALATELRRTREERDAALKTQGDVGAVVAEALGADLRRVARELDAARQELAAARAAIGEAWFLRPDDSIALALSRKTTALERLAGGETR